MAILVALFTYFGWATFYVIGAVGSGLSGLLRGDHHSPPSVLFGGVWQWIVASAAAGLISILLGAPHYSRVAGIAWFGTIAVLAVNSIFMPGQYDPAIGPVIIFLMTFVLFAWILAGTRRAA